MKRATILLLAIFALFAGCSSHPQYQHRVASAELKRITQFDTNRNVPIKTWDARADSIHEQDTPPIGVTFVDAATGQTVHLDGTYQIESYRAMSKDSTAHNETKSPGDP